MEYNNGIELYLFYISYCIFFSTSSNAGRNVRPSNFYGTKKTPSQSPFMRYLGRLPSLSMDDEDVQGSKGKQSYYLFISQSIQFIYC